MKKTQGKTKIKFSPPLPIAGPDNVSIEIKDDSLAPWLRKGSYINYNRNAVIFSDFDQLLDENCVVCLDNGDVVPRTLDRGMDGKYNLLDYKGVLVERSASIAWAVVIDAFIPAKKASP